MRSILMFGGGDDGGRARPTKRLPILHEFKKKNAINLETEPDSQLLLRLLLPKLH
jgi:hypothetical protein